MVFLPVIVTPQGLQRVLFSLTSHVKCIHLSDLFPDHFSVTFSCRFYSLPKVSIVFVIINCFLFSYSFVFDKNYDDDWKRYKERHPLNSVYKVRLFLQPHAHKFGM